MLEREKKIYTDFLIKINSGMRDVLPGMNTYREWWFREYWSSSLVLSYWRHSAAFKLFIMNPLGLYIEESNDFGGSKYWIKDTGTLTDKSDKNTETNTVVTTPYTTKKFKNGDYDLLPLIPGIEDFNVVKRAAQSYDLYPVPYLVSTGTVSLHKFKEACRKSDTAIMKALVKMILHFKKGTDTLAQQGKLPTGEDIKNFAERIKVDLKEAIDKPAIVASRYDEDIKYITPDTSILERTKYDEVDRDIAESLGWLSIQESSRGGREVTFNPKLLILEIESAVKINNEVINYFLEQVRIKKDLRMAPTFLPPVTDVWLTDAAKALLNKLYGEGLLSKPTAINALTPSTYMIERQRRIEEITNNDSDVFDPPIIMKQAIKTPEVSTEPNDGRPSDQDNDNQNAEFIYNEMIDEEVLGEFYNVPFIAATIVLGKEADKHWTECLLSDYAEAPYKSNDELPPAVKKLSTKLQTVWRKAFNSAWDTYRDKPIKERETLCFKISWSVVNRMKKQD